MRTWTEEQKTAIYAEGCTLLICAAAGSGKTSVLVERIVRKLTDPDHPVPPDRLLVVTFTNAAAAEMRARIYKRLTELLAQSPYSRELRALMSRLDEMNVCTMDSYCMRLVREHFSVCGIEPDFGVIEEGEEKALKTQTVHLLADELYEQPEAYGELLQLFRAGRDDGVLHEGILALSDFSMSEDAPAAWLDTVGKYFGGDPIDDSVWCRILTRWFQEGAGYCAAQYEDALSLLPEEPVLQEKLGSLFTAEYNALNELFRVLHTGNWETCTAALCDTLGVFGAKFPTLRGMNDNPVKQRVKAKRDEVKEVLKKLCALAPANAQEHAEDVAALAPAVTQLIAAVKRFNELLFAAKKERNLFGFADIAHFAVSLLYDPAAPDGKTPLARELAAGLSEILIDEYQDTNRVQERLFMCLSTDEANMFLVGDVKQSIYRFRLASPELFTEKLEHYPKYDPAVPVRKAKIVLSRNFRSRRGITDMVNYTFSSLMSKAVGEITYSEDEALVYGASYPECDEPDTEVHLIDATDPGTAEIEGNYIAQLIKERMAGGLTVTENGASRPARYGDFCILLRSAKQTADVYANALRANGLPVYCDSHEGYFSAAEVRMALSFLRAVDDPLSDLDLLAAMLSPVGLFTPEHAARLKSDLREISGKRQPLYAAVTLGAENGDAQCVRFLELLERFRMLSATAPVAEVVHTFLNETPVLSAVRAMDGGALREANLRVLYETAVKFTEDSQKNLCSFLRYIDVLIENGSDLKRGSLGGDKNCVSILTMHRSKGLEYPFVIIGGLTKRFHLSERSSVLGVSHRFGVGVKRRESETLQQYDTMSSVAIRLSLRSEALSEEMRIYYVALTRAKEKLFIVCAPKGLDALLWANEMLLPVSGGLSPYALVNAAEPMRWFLPVILRHPDCAVFRAEGGAGAKTDFHIAAYKITNREALPPAAPAVPAADPVLLARLKEQISHPYYYAPVSGALSLHTASKLREERFSSEFFGKSAPAFMFSAALTPADIGTATHRFLELCDFAAARRDPGAEVRRLVSMARLTEAQGNAVDLSSIAAFLSSAFYERIARAEAVFRERSFTIAKSVCDFDPAVPAAFADEKTVVIGKLDLVFIEDGAAVIVDYKTDHVQSVSELPPRYGAQLALYGEAVEKSLGYKVKEKILYSLTLKDFAVC